MTRSPYDVPADEPLRRPGARPVRREEEEEEPLIRPGAPGAPPPPAMRQPMPMPPPQQRPPQPMPQPQRPPQAPPQMPPQQQRPPQPMPQQGERSDPYRKWSISLGAGILLLLLLGVLFLDGMFTVAAAQAVGWAMSVGVAIHLFVVALQLFVWKVPSEARRHPVLAPYTKAVTVICYTVSILAGTVNTLTSTMGLSALFRVDPLVLDWALPMTVLAEMMAMIPEPVVVVCVVILYGMHIATERNRR